MLQTLRLVQISLLFNFSAICLPWRLIQIFLLFIFLKKYLPQPEIEKHLRKLWNTDFKKHFGSARKRCSFGTLYCARLPKSLTTSQNDLNYYIAKKHNAPKLDITFKRKLRYQEFPGCHALRQHKNTQNGFPISRTNAELDDIINDVDDANPEEELRSRQYFLVDSELECVRHKVFNFGIENLNATKVDETLDHFLINSKCAVKVKLTIEFILKSIEDVNFCYNYAHENNNLLDRSKVVCTKDDLGKLKNLSTKLTSSSCVVEKQ